MRFFVLKNHTLDAWTFIYFCGFFKRSETFFPKTPRKSNIASYAADLWSNESVQQVKLLSGFAPVVSTEQLIYDWRLLNKATEKGCRKLMRDLLIESDCYLNPQAYILKPENVFEMAGEIVKTQDPFLRTLNTARVSLDILQRGVDQGELTLEGREVHWLDTLRSQLEEIPEDEAHYTLSEYGI